MDRDARERIADFVVRAFHQSVRPERKNLVDPVIVLALVGMPNVVGLPEVRFPVHGHEVGRCGAVTFQDVFHASPFSVGDEEMRRISVSGQSASQIRDEERNVIGAVAVQIQRDALGVADSKVVVGASVRILERREQILHGILGERPETRRRAVELRSPGLHPCVCVRNEKKCQCGY